MNRPLSLTVLTLVVGIPALGVLCTSTASSEEKKAAPKASATAYSPANVKAGQQVFNQRCMQCHSVAEGEVRFGPSLYHVMQGPKPRKTPAQVREYLANGKNKMPSFKGILTPDDVDHVIAYLHSL